MSHLIKGNNITLTRGDTLIIQIELTKGEEEYTPQTGDTIRFAVKQKYKDPDESVLIFKQIPTETMLLEIEPDDTKPLTMGKDYVYDIELTDSQGHVDTFISGILHIGEEVI